MANNLPTIPTIEVGTNPSKSWRHWKEDFEDYLEALRYSEAPEEIKAALFCHLCREELKKQLQAFDLKPNDGCEGITLQQVHQEFNKYFLDYPKMKFLLLFKFLEIKQEQGEKNYFRLCNDVVECNCGKSQDRMLHKIIQGLLDKALQEKLIRETSKNAKTQQEVVNECKAAENSKVQASVMNEKLSVNALKNLKKNQNQCKNNQKNEVNCEQCGKIHGKKKCSSYGAKCRNCDGRNHWAKMCRTQRNKQKNMAARRENAIEETSENSETIYIRELKSVNELDMKETNCVRIQPEKDMSSPAKLLMRRKLRIFLPSHSGQLKHTFDVERAREVLRKRQIIQNNMLTREDGGVFRRNRFHIRQDYTENDNPRWSRTVEDLYNSDATEISRIPNDSADSQRNASPKTNRCNINQRLQVPIETYNGQSNPVVQKSLRNIVKPVHYRDNLKNSDKHFSLIINLRELKI
ncbi:reverse transcriptase domain-containing protein [Trichonephila clavipes]|nr:reverse transcriptase domain-containing protein [Trichonephila clavipes]